MHEKRCYVELEEAVLGSDGSDTAPPGDSVAAMAAEEPRALVLVEGPTDRIALETLARRLGRDLAAERVRIVELGGAHAIGRFLAVLRPHPGLRLAGLCDAGERPVFERALARAGVDVSAFHVCDRDLEDELIRAVGEERLLELLDRHGDLVPFRTFERQPPWRGRPLHDQLRRFLCSSANRKARYARIVVEALEPDRAPAPLRGVLDAVP